MKYLIYMSSAVKLLNQDELKNILITSRENNKRDNLTGMLLYSLGSFVQALEGEATMLNAAFERIKQDNRHKSIILLTEGDLQERIFGNWSMGFRAASESELAQFEAYVDPAEAKILQANIHPALTVLKIFAQNNNY